MPRADSAMDSVAPAITPVTSMATSTSMIE
jgi:hypothetical protein